MATTNETCIEHQPRDDQATKASREAIQKKSSQPAGQSSPVGQVSKVVVHIAYPLWRQHVLLATARAKELQDEGNEVVVTYCAAKGGSCVCNQTGNRVVCQICRLTTRRTAAKLGLQAVGLDGTSNSLEPTSKVSLSERKELVEGVLSELISEFRVLPADIKHHWLLRRLKRRSYQTSQRLLQQFKSLMQREQPDRFEVSNGRHGCSKSGLLAARAQAIPFNTFEATARKRPIIHQGHTAHDRQGIQRRILSQPLDMELADEFYRRRRSPQGNRFAKHHQQAFDPAEFVGFRKLVSIFLSSQDEFASLGRAWKSPFDEEYAVIERLCKQFPETMFCIRFHPNQRGIKSDIISPFASLNQQPNVRIYYPVDAVNTYQLIESSQVVVVFNSTVAAEACWMGKPVIMIGPSFYDALEVGYTPKDEAELWQLLARESLPPKSRENAARLAHYSLKDGNRLKYIRVDNGRMAANGAERSLPWLTVLARGINTALSELIKPFV